MILHELKHTGITGSTPTTATLDRCRVSWRDTPPSHVRPEIGCTGRLCVLLVPVILLTLSPPACPDRPGIDKVMYLDPVLSLPERTIVFSEKLLPLWLQALARDEAELQKKAVNSIATAHQRGMSGLVSTVPRITEALTRADCHPMVRLAAAKTLVVLDARETAPLLMNLVTQQEIEASQLIEPALAQWDYKPMREIWLERLNSHKSLRRQQLLAVNGLATVGETKAADSLLQLAVDRRERAQVRLESARAAGRLRTHGLHDAASRLVTDGSVRSLVDRLIAASLLVRHDGDDTRLLLMTLAVDPEPAVAAIALRRLIELDPGLISAMAERFTSSRDPNLRRLGAQSLVECPTLQAIKHLGPMLNDPHPDIRQYVRTSMLQLSEHEQFDGAVRDAATVMLASNQWRGLEQAAILLSHLDHEAAADRLIKLLEFPRPEVFVTAAWALRKIAVSNTLDAMLDRAVLISEADHKLKEVGEALPQQISQLFQAFGEMKFTKSHTLLRRYIPKNSFHGEPRAAAIWALGYLYAGNAPNDLTEQLADRLTDLNPIKPERPVVRRMSAVSLGRMNSTQALPALREIVAIQFPGHITGHASVWAIDQITGEGIPEASLPDIEASGWFLEPID